MGYVQDQLGANDLPHPLAVRLARVVAQRLREERGVGCTRELIGEVLRPLCRPGPSAVINATGIMLHTNLGRSPLDPEILGAALSQVAGYTDLELDLETGKRGHRDRHFAGLARLVWGVEDATLVNNAAAAVGLALTALGANRETVVSRGELIEIGGSFRLPDIMGLAGTELVEVGTTNKTKIEDYAAAIGPETACLLKTHPSNYRIQGFTREVSLEQLVALGKKRRVPVVMDLGSGLSSYVPFPGVGEPSIEDYLRVGPDLLIFSGDKLFGSVQAGIVLGKKSAVAKLRKHPMMRMVRMDKLGIAIVCHQLARAAMGQANPLTGLALVEPEDLSRRALSIKERCPSINLVCEEDTAYLGGGSLPQERRPGWSLLLEHPKPDEVAGALRMGTPPVIGYIRRNRLRFNLASVPADQDQALIQALNRVLTA